MADARALGALEVADLAHHLPPDAAVWRALNPDHPWGLAEQLLATLVDETRVGWWLYESAHVKKKDIRKPPRQIPRPGVAEPEDERQIGGRESALPLDEMAAWLGWGSPIAEVKRPRDARGRFVKVA